MMFSPVVHSEWVKSNFLSDFRGELKKASLTGWYTKSSQVVIVYATNSVVLHCMHKEKKNGAGTSSRVASTEHSDSVKWWTTVSAQYSKQEDVPLGISPVLFCLYMKYNSRYHFSLLSYH